MFYIDKFGSETLVQNLDNFMRIIPHNYGLRINPDETVKILRNNLLNRFYLSRRQNENLIKEEEYESHLLICKSRPKITREEEEAIEQAKKLNDIATEKEQI